jgi:hypothetical protein
MNPMSHADEWYFAFGLRQLCPLQIVRMTGIRVGWPGKAMEFRSSESVA